MTSTIECVEIDVEELVLQPQIAIAQRKIAYERFCQKLLDGELKASEFVSQRELTRLLKLSIAVVREAIPRLEAVNLIRTLPRRGLQVANVDLDLVRNTFQIRAMIEREAIANFVHSASGEDLAVLQEAFHALERRAGEYGKLLSRDVNEFESKFFGKMIDYIKNDLFYDFYYVNNVHLKLIRNKLDGFAKEDGDLIVNSFLCFFDSAKNRKIEESVQIMMRRLISEKQRILGFIHFNV
jgi:DNA-binding GntR family transcriptional regulator